MSDPLTLRAGKYLLSILATAAVLGCKPEKPPITARTELMVPETWSPTDSATLWNEIIPVLGPVHKAPCNGCIGPDSVTIRSVGKTTDVKPENGPDHPRPVALIQNKTNLNVTHQPTGFVFKAKHSYLMMLSKRAGETATSWGFTELGPDYDPHYTIGSLVPCRDSGGYEKIDDANFYNCGDAHTVTRSSSWVKSAYASPVRPAATEILKRGWISCDPDCCTGAPTYSN